MKRLLIAVALALSLATAAQATTGKVVIVYPNKINQTGGGAGEQIHWLIQRNLGMLTDILDRGGVEYFLLPGSQAKVEQLRQGVIQRGAQVDTVLGVIHSSYLGTSSHATQTSGYRGDSLTRVAYGTAATDSLGGMRVPHLFLCDNVPLLGVSAGSNYLDETNAAFSCSTGVAGAKTAPSDDVAAYWYGDKSIRFQGAPYNAGWELNSSGAADYPGGIRTILGLSSSGMSILRQEIMANPVQRNATWPDSMPFLAGATADTVIIWERPWANLATCSGAKSQLFVDWSGAGSSFDSLSTEVGFNRPLCEGTLQTLLIGLARFDSLCGGLFQKPISGAITVQSALSRGLRRWNQGIAPGDTAVFYGSLDSLNAWGVPVTFYANIDSASTYARDVIKLKEVSRARFAPQVWDGVADSTVGYVRVPRDPFGRWTQRAIYGDGSRAGKDTSMYAHLYAAQSLTDSVFGAARRSRSLRAAFDDWSPIGVNISGNMAKVDSILWMLPNKLGVRALVINGRGGDFDINTAKGPPATNPKGALRREGRYNSSLNRSTSLNLLAHGGGQLGGGLWQAYSCGDSATRGGNISNINNQISRSMAGLCTRWWTDHDVLMYDELDMAGRRAFLGVSLENEDMFPQFNPARASIIQVSCADLSGNPVGPARSGLWAIKSLWESSRIANALSYRQRTVFKLTYPEDVEPWKR